MASPEVDGGEAEPNGEGHLEEVGEEERVEEEEERVEDEEVERMEDEEVEGVRGTRLPLRFMFLSSVTEKMIMRRTKVPSTWSAARV